MGVERDSLNRPCVSSNRSIRGTPAVRSWLYAPGHNERILGKVCDAHSDEVVLDLEDAVPRTLKEAAQIGGGGAGGASRLGV